MKTHLRVLALLALLPLAACGGGPTKGQIQAAINTAAKQQLGPLVEENADLNRLTGQSVGPTTMPEFKVTDATCTAHENGVYLCSVTEEAMGRTGTQDVRLKLVRGDWVMLQ